MMTEASESLALIRFSFLFYVQQVRSGQVNCEVRWVYSKGVEERSTDEVRFVFQDDSLSFVGIQFGSLVKFSIQRGEFKVFRVEFVSVHFRTVWPRVGLAEVCGVVCITCLKIIHSLVRIHLGSHLKFFARS